MRWMVLGLLAPELVVWNAVEQRKQVKRLNILMREKGFMPAKSSALGRLHQWIAWARQRAKVFLML